MNKERPALHKIVLSGIEYAGLGVIAVATVIAAGTDIVDMIRDGRIVLGDLLLLFIYLEVLAMIGLYFESGELPVRYPLYIAIVALARYIIIDMKDMADARLITTAAAILVLAVSVLIIRYGHLPYRNGNRPIRLRRSEDEQPPE